MRTCAFLLAMLPWWTTATLLAQDIAPWNQASAPAVTQQAPVASQPAAPPAPDLNARLGQLEAETQALRAEVKRLQEQPVRLPDTVASANVAPPPPPPEQFDDYFTLDELRGEMKKLAWKKGDYSITPYGILWGNSVYSTQRTYPGSYTMWVQSATAHPEGEFLVDGRNSRLGFDIGGPQFPLFCCAKTGGKIEIDFQQNSILSATGNPSTENKATVLLRHAYAEAKNDDFRLVIGQTWDVISPLNPGTLLYSVGWDAGNIGYRRAQVRGERYFALSDTSLITSQLSINQQVFEDGSSTIKGETSNWPILEGRVAWTVGDRTPCGLPTTIGISGHIGEEQFDYGTTTKNNRSRTWSGNIDFRMPITERLGFQAECFTGENLGAFLGGIGQGIDSTTLHTISSSGGWFEVWYYWTPSFHSHVGYSVDDPNDADLTTTGGRTYNQFFYGNLAYDVNKNFLIGIEVSSWKTLFVNQLPGDAVRTEFVVKYGFQLPAYSPCPHSPLGARLSSSLPGWRERPAGLPTEIARFEPLHQDRSLFKNRLRRMRSEYVPRSHFFIPTWQLFRPWGLTRDRHG